MHFRHQRAFSLLELLVCIAIIAVLTAVVLPLAKSTTERSRSATCVGHLKQLATGSLAYAADCGGELPPLDRKNENTGASWYIPLSQYLPHNGYGKRSGPYFCPANPTRVVASGNAGWTNYAINGNLYLVNTSQSNQGQSDPDHISKRRGALLSHLTSPKVYYIDSFSGNYQSPTTWYVSDGSRYSNPWGSIFAVHGERVNAVFTDGHAESLRIAPRPADLKVGGDLLELKGSSFWPL